MFTPNGELISLPKGAMPLDFAFAVHTDIGINCIGVKINNSIKPLYTKLKNGDQVEIITGKEKSFPDGLNYLLLERHRLVLKDIYTLKRTMN